MLMGRKINPPVFFTAAALTIILLLTGVLFTEEFEKGINYVNEGINSMFGWFIILSVSIFLGFVLFLMCSKYGNIRLSPDDSKPKYSFFAWVAMLFSAGMGIGLLFYGVAEPMLHYSSPPSSMVEAETVEAAKVAMDFSFLHWGLHAWATYIVVGLAVAYFGYRRGYPLSIRYIFYPIFGNRIYGAVGHVIEVLAVLGTLFGVATSLGLGAMQINRGLNFLFGVEFGNMTQIILIIIISLLATISVATGVSRGIKWLSVFNVSVGGFLLLFVIIFGPTIFIFKAFVENIGHFLHNFVDISLWNHSFEDTGWQGNWTIFYWSWWIAWSPYVGIFIARISKGRTIREFILGVLFIPTLLGFLWLTAFGSTGILYDLQGEGELMGAVKEDITTALFKFLEFFPFTLFISLLATIVIVTFFVTSSDSGSLVIDMITSGGEPDPPVIQRIFWALLQGAVAAILLLGGGLIALETAAISMGLPFAVVLLLLCYSLYKQLKTEDV